MSFNGIGVSGGWNGCVHLLKEPIAEVGLDPVDAVTMCGRRLQVLPMSNLAINDRNCRRCYPTPREWSAREWNAMTEQLQSLAARLAAVSLPVEEQQ